MYQLAMSSKCLFTRSFTVAHEVEVTVTVSQPGENRSKQIVSSSAEPAHNGKIGMRSPLSNAIKQPNADLIQQLLKNQVKVK